MPTVSETLVPFKMFGLQRTGTNLMVALMLRNFDVHSLESGTEWKHGPVKMPQRTWNRQPARFVLCVKNPYAWAVSCYRYFRKAKGVDATVAPEFLAKPSMSFEEFVTGPTYGFPTPIHRWNVMYRLWLNTLPADRTVLVRHEDQLRDQVCVLKTVERRLGLVRRAAALQPIHERIDVNAKPVGPMDVRYYEERAYLRKYSPQLLEATKLLVDKSLSRQLGYDSEVALRKPS